MKLMQIIAGGAVALTGTMAMADSHGMAKTVTDIVVGSKVHTTLETAVIAADLAETLSGKGPFTVFAPTDDAFALVPKETLSKALMPENKALLTQILGCHVVATKAMAADVIKLVADGAGSAEVKTIGNCLLTLTVKHGKVKINGVGTVTAADLEAGNGVVHVIDRVIVPAM